MVLSFNAINALRQHIRPSSRIHGIITDGGRAANIVPAHSAARFMVRAADAGYLETLKSRVIACFAGAASATGTALEYRWADAFCLPMRYNSGLAGIFQNNISALGREMDASCVEFASTDMGNVSQLLPSIHPIIAIAPAGTGLHSIEFQKAAGSESGIRGMLDGALAMAWTAIDLLADSRAMDEVRSEFQRPRTGEPC
jgi:metal-dependent amidase/aminoacylase/carboxypeptidase family protein